MSKMNTDLTNCSAFPVVIGDPDQWHHESGMTLRDYFAAKAMASLLAQPESAHEWDDDQIADWAYNAADAMIARRQNQGEQK